MTLKGRLSERVSGSRGVSPVNGVILMVAITVVLAAVIGAFVMDFGSNIDKNANAGIAIEETNNGVDVQLNSLGNVDNSEDITVKCANDASDECGVDGSASFDKGGVGQTKTVTASTGDEIIITAEIDGSESVIQRYEKQ